MPMRLESIRESCSINQQPGINVSRVPVSRMILERLSGLFQRRKSPGRVKIHNRSGDMRLQRLPQIPAGRVQHHFNTCKKGGTFLRYPVQSPALPPENKKGTTTAGTGPLSF